MSELEQLVARIVEVAQPTHIYLFGSRARGNARPDSDYDFLVVEDRPVHTRQVGTRIRRHLRGFGVPVDVIVARTEQIERYKDHPALIYYTAISEGILCYERPQQSS